MIEILGENDVGLFGLLVKDIVGQGFALVKQSNVVECIDTDRDAGFAQGIAGTLGLDLVDNLVELDSQVFGNNALFLPGQDGVEIVLGRERTMSIHRTARRQRKALVEVLDEGGQKGVAILPTADFQEAHFLGQAILQGQDDTFDTTFGLGRVGANDLDVQFLHSPSKLGQGITGTTTALIDTKDAVFIAVEGDRLAVGTKILVTGLGVAEEAFVLDELQVDQSTTGIVDEDQQATGGCPTFKPVMR